MDNAIRTKSRHYTLVESSVIWSLDVGQMGDGWLAKLRNQQSVNYKTSQYETPSQANKNMHRKCCLLQQTYFLFLIHSLEALKQHNIFIWLIPSK